MAFLAPLVEAGADAAGAEAAGGAAEGASGGGLMSKVGGLFKSTPQPTANEQNKQQNVGESRTQNFQDAATAVRSAVRPGSGGVD